MDMYDFIYAAIELGPTLLIVAGIIVVLVVAVLLVRNKTKKRKAACAEYIYVSLIGMVAALITFYIVTRESIENLWEYGYIFCMIPYFIGFYLLGSLGGVIGARIASWVNLRFTKITS